MSYPADLDEMSEQRLVFELGRRAGLRAQGKCDYCERPWDTAPACRFTERHSPSPVTRASSVNPTNPFHNPVEFPKGTCPDCGSSLFNPGPRGGSAWNIRCAGCAAKFWYSPPFPSQRIFGSLEQAFDVETRRTLDEF